MMPRKASKKEAREFRQRIYTHHGRYHFETMADGDVWVLDGDEFDLSPRGVRAMRTALSQFGIRHGYTTSMQVRDGVVMIRITEGRAW